MSRAPFTPVQQHRIDFVLDIFEGMEGLVREYIEDGIRFALHGAKPPYSRALIDLFAEPYDAAIMEGAWEGDSEVAAIEDLDRLMAFVPDVHTPGAPHNWAGIHADKLAERRKDIAFVAFERDHWMRQTEECRTRNTELHNRIIDLTAQLKEQAKEFERLRELLPEPKYGQSQIVPPVRISWAEPVPDLTEPVPVVLRRLREGETATHWVGGDILSNSPYWAKQHIRFASEGYKTYLSAQAFLSRKVITDHTGWVEHSERYEPSLADLLDYYDEGNTPAWVHPCTKVPFEPRWEDWLDSYLADEHHEDASGDLIDEDGLYKFLAEWTAKQQLASQQSEFDIIVVDQARYDAERARCQKIVDEWKAGEPERDDA